MAIWLTSDTHINHTNVISYCNRPFSSVEEMNEALINNWNSVVNPEDSIYCLGDFSLSFLAAEKYSPRLMGKKFLVPGNHDHCHSFHKKSRSLENRVKWIQKYQDLGWKVLPEQTTLELDGIGVVNMCHHPYSSDDSSGEAYEDKYANWRPTDDGRVLLCGHVHDKFSTKRSEKGSLMINVGVDVFGMRPVSLETIKKIIEDNK